MPLTRISSTITERSGIVNPNSRLYLCYVNVHVSLHVHVQVHNIHVHVYCTGKIRMVCTRTCTAYVEIFAKRNFLSSDKDCIEDMVTITALAKIFPRTFSAIQR